MFRTSLVHRQGAHQSLHKTIMSGLIAHVEELLVIFGVVKCYTLDKSSVWKIQEYSPLFYATTHVLPDDGPTRCETYTVPCFLNMLL
jgi:hypothetical protein